jgi:aminopeptidase N
MKRLMILIVLFSSITTFGQKVCSHRGLRVDFSDPNNARSDSMDIIQYNLHLDFTEFSAEIIKGACQVEYVSLWEGLDRIGMDLLGMTVDSVTTTSGTLAFDYVSPLLVVYFSEPLALDASGSFTVHYHGTPQTDPSWGGFYYSSAYAFNMGVGFDADPHNFGRAWFPCFDNFVERSKYHLSVLTNGGRKAYCGGLRVSETQVGVDSLLTVWHLDSPIPSYLASVAVSDYVHTEQHYLSENGSSIPVWLISTASDSTEMKNSFVNLLPWLEGLESKFGPHPFEKVGFVGVPFNAGAMEHATNIAYPLSSYQGGSLADETLYAHELTHHWWGDHVTCSTAEDMWLNEGWASYGEALFLEHTQSRAAYIDYMRTKHKYVLLRAHRDDGAYMPVSGVPHELTYGTHVYDKGRDIVHTLRTVMGDDAFFAACRSYQQSRSFQWSSTDSLRHHFQNFTSEDLTSFFNQWVYQPGFADFRISAWTQNNNVSSLTIEQQLHHAEELYTNVPVEVFFIGENNETFSTTVHASGFATAVEVTLPENFIAKRAWLNQHDGLALSCLGLTKWYRQAGSELSTYPEIEYQISSYPNALDSTLIRVEGHWSDAHMPMQIAGTDYVVSGDRWWSVNFDSAAQLGVDATIRYFGSATSSTYFDPEFFSWMSTSGYDENNMIVFYRPLYSSTWEPYTGNFTLSPQGSTTNWTGRIQFENMLPGDYCWGVRTGQVNVLENNQQKTKVYFESGALYLTGTFEGEVSVYDSAGKKIVSDNKKRESSLRFDANNWASGVYVVRTGIEDFKTYKP